MLRRSCPLVVAIVAVVAVALSLAGCGDDGSGDTSSEPTSTTRARPTPVEVPDSTLPGPAAFEGPLFHVPANGIEIGYRQFGDGPDLVMVMGDTGTMTLWTPSLLRALAEHFRVTIFDNRGVAATSDDGSHLTIPLMADDTAAFLEALGLERPTVLGWSMGGEIALTMAIRHPDAAGKIVTVGSDAGGPHTPAGSVTNAELNDPNASSAQFLSWIFPPTPAGQAASQAFVEQYLAVPQEQESAETDVAQGRAEDEYAASSSTWDGLPDIHLPLLLVAGSDDVVVPAEASELVAGRAPDARVVIFEGAGHGLAFQDEDAFVDLVVRFVADPSSVHSGRVVDGRYESDA